MQEKILNHKKNGMTMLFLIILLYLGGIACVVFGSMQSSKATILSALLITVGSVWLAVGWIPLCGLKVLKPQEALVLTLFGNYVGTLKEEGFFINLYFEGRES